MIIIGIDAGLHGAIAVINGEGRLLELVDTPTLQVQSGKIVRHHYQIPGMANIIRCVQSNYQSKNKIIAGLEKQHSRPIQGVVQAFTTGEGYGVWRAILVMLDISFDLPTPQAWKKVMLPGMGKDKDASRLRAQQLFPNAQLHLKRHHDRAEALLIAEYIRRTCGEVGGE